MIVASLLLIAGAATLLVLGLWQSSSVLLSGSIAASLLAAVTLVVGARRAADAPTTAARRGSATATTAPVARVASAPPAPPPAAGQTVAIPSQTMGAQPVGGPPGPPADLSEPAGSAPARPDREDATPDHTAPTYSAGSVLREAVTPPAQFGEPAGRAAVDDEDPADEPAPQQVSAADSARVSRLHTDVLVVDGRPRYHLPGCVHLMARESEPLPVAEALELGFTPCGLCEPDSALLADARRV